MNVRISKTRSISDWHQLSAALERDIESEELWNDAIEYFKDRINSRYFEPIDNIIELTDGAGFSIIAILCSLIEYLQTFRTGKTYRKATKASPLDENEYFKSEPIFIEFLTNNPPFNSSFTHENSLDFYENVRCSILHEATTKNN